MITVALLTSLKTLFSILGHFIRELIESNVVSLEQIFIENQFVDLFTKRLDGLRFESFIKAVVICVPP